MEYGVGDFCLSPHHTHDGMMSLIVTGLDKLSPTICHVPTILDVRLMLNFELNTDHKFIFNVAVVLRSPYCFYVFSEVI